MALTHAANGTNFATTPLFIQVATWISAQIEAGELTGQLPTELELARTIKVSGGTMRKALDELETRGLLTRIQGRGTFVRERVDVSKLPRQARALIEALGEFSEGTRNEILKAVQARLHELANGNGGAA